MFSYIELFFEGKHQLCLFHFKVISECVFLELNIGRGIMGKCDM